MNDFYISSVIDKNGYYKTTTLDVGNSYYGMINITDEDKDVQSITITQTRKSDSYIIGPVTTNLPTISETAFLAYAEFTPDFPGTWDVFVFVTDSNGNKSNTLTLQVEVWESGKYIIIFIINTKLLSNYYKLFYLLVAGAGLGACFLTLINSSTSFFCSLRKVFNIFLSGS